MYFLFACIKGSVKHILMKVSGYLEVTNT